MEIKTPFYIKAYLKDKKQVKYSKKIKKDGRYFFPFDENTKPDLSGFELAFLYRNLSVPFNGDKLIIPDGVEIIEDNCFEDCFNLKEIKFPDSLVGIGIEAFKNCSSLEKIVIPNSVSIARLTFVGCTGLRELYLPKMKASNIIYIENCPNIEKLTLHTTYEIPFYLIRDCRKSLKEINVEYSSFEDLLKFIENNSGTYFILYAIFGIEISHIKYSEFINKNEINWDDAKKILNFEGPKLSNDEQEKIKQIFGEKIFNLITFTPKLIISNYDEDIQSIVNKILDLCDKIPIDVKNKVNQHILELLTQYDKDLKLIKPSFDDDIKFDTNPGNIKILKASLLSDLEVIEFEILQNKNLFSFLDKLDNYKKIIAEKTISFDELNQDDLSIENMLKIIVSGASYLDDDAYLKSIKDKINSFIEEKNKVLNSLFDKKATIELNNIDTEKDFELFISNIFNDIKFKVNQIRPIKELYDELSIDGEIKFSDDADIISLIHSIRYVISSFESEKYKRELTNYFDNICLKYRKILKNILDSENSTKYTDIGLIKKNLREDMQPLLVIMNRFANIEKHGIYKITSEGILEQLEKSISIINEEITSFDEYEKWPITSYVIDVLNLLKYSSLEKDDIKKIKIKLLNIINSNIEKVKLKKFEDYDDYNELLHVVMVDIANIYLKTDMYITRLNEYSGYVKK